MKRNILKAIGVASLAIAVMAGCAQVLVFAQDPVPSQDVVSAPQHVASHEKDNNELTLVGSWNAEVTIRDCSTGAALFTFPSMLTYHDGGTMAETDLGAPVLTRLPGQGVWQQERGGRQYSAAFQWLNFDPARNFAGRSVVRSRISLGRWGDTYTSTDRNEVLDEAGNPIPGLRACATTRATRFN